MLLYGLERNLIYTGDRGRSGRYGGCGSGISGTSAYVEKRAGEDCAGDHAADGRINEIVCKIDKSFLSGCRKRAFILLQICEFFSIIDAKALFEKTQRKRYSDGLGEYYGEFSYR